MPNDPRIRASDADRDRVAALLREHHAAGRLTAEEFHERVDKALEAKTLGELGELMADLPDIDVYQWPDQSLRRAAPGARRPPGAQSPFRPAETGASGDPAVRPPQAIALGIALVGAVVTAYVVAGVVTGIWIPWWVLIVIPVILIRRFRR